MEEQRLDLQEDNNLEKLNRQIAYKKITELKMKGHYYDYVVLGFGDGSELLISDLGQDCCETRLLPPDDDLPYFIGSVIREIEIRDVRIEYESDRERFEEVAKERKYLSQEYLECQFLLINTNLGTISISAYNSSNGCYTGFRLTASYKESE